jgi:hypothetical protein
MQCPSNAGSIAEMMRASSSAETLSKQRNAGLRTTLIEAAPPSAGDTVK